MSLLFHRYKIISNVYDAKPSRCRSKYTINVCVKMCFVFQQLKKATVVSDQFFDLPLSSKQKYARDAKKSHGYVASGQE